METKHTFDSVFSDLQSGKEVSLNVVSDLISDFFHQNYKNISRENFQNLIWSKSILFDGSNLEKDLDFIESVNSFLETNEIFDCVFKGLSPLSILIVYQKNKTVYSTVIGLDERVY